MTAPTRSGVKVSVVVPVYNPGSYLEACIESIVRQSLPPAEFEGIFVDDGSTDASPARLDELAATHSNMHVIHQPNSGWPGKPRNVGTDAARGKYVYFVDHDDLLGREALERLYDFAERNSSDIVIGKMAGHGRGAPRQIFAATHDRVTIDESSIITALSPHKLFRKAFLDEHAIRFPEGRRRLEDQVFVVTAYFAADVISILSDYTCYYHLARVDGANAASGLYDPSGRFDASYYYRFLREVLDVIEANTDPGPRRDRLLRRFARREIVGRVGGWKFLLTKPGRRRLLLDEVRSVVERYIPPSVDPGLAPLMRVRMALVRADRLDLLVALARAEDRVGHVARVRGVRPLAGRRLWLDVEAELVDDGRPLVFDQSGDHLLLPVPAAVAAEVPDAARLVALPESGMTQVVLRRRSDSTEVIVASTMRQRLVQSSGGVRVIEAVEAVIDLDAPEEEHAVRSGTWDVIVRTGLGGFQFDQPLRRPASLGRSRPVVLLDGALARTRATWTLGLGRPSRLIRRAALVGRRLLPLAKARLRHA